MIHLKNLIILIRENLSDEIIKIVHSLDLDTEFNLNSISLSSESSSGISQLKELIETYNEIAEEEYLDLTEVPPTPDLLEAQLEKEFLEEIILNLADEIPSYESLEKIALHLICAGQTLYLL